MLQEDISVDNPAAAEAFEKYIAAEADYQAAVQAFNKTLNLDQIMSAQEETLEALEKFNQQAALESLNRTLSLYNPDELEALKAIRVNYNSSKYPLPICAELCTHFTVS